MNGPIYKRQGRKIEASQSLFPAEIPTNPKAPCVNVRMMQCSSTIMGDYPTRIVRRMRNIWHEQSSAGVHPFRAPNMCIGGGLMLGGSSTTHAEHCLAGTAEQVSDEFPGIVI
ncbi:hypothetical protein L484_014609 [Morus notabilis]|uniref:Uncharacterized protein n=1 Tax=Morus notabilis TaxID=981085 RepID=W9R917_9ROSA|nr:hypothetical protein L484_014609 [Morus notabilis]